MMMTRTMRVFTAAIAVLAATVHADGEAAAEAAAPWPTEIREGSFSFFPDEAAEDEQASADGPGRRSLLRARATSSGSWFSDRREVRIELEKRCDVILWGREIESDAARDLVGGNAVNYFSPDSAWLRRWLMSQVDLSTDSSTSEIVQFLVQNGKLDLSSGTVDGGVLTYTKWNTRCHFCIKDSFVGNSCDKCGKWLEPEPLKHQPFICAKYKPGSLQYPREIRLVNNYSDKNLCMDYNYYTANTYMYECHGYPNQKWYMASDGTMRSPKDDSLCLDMHLETKNVYSHPCHGSDNQQWIFSSHGRIRNAREPTMCLSMREDDNNLYVGECHLGWTQFFRWAASN